MLIVIEGLDRTGKSTLARELADALQLSAQVEHFSKPRGHPLDEYVQLLDGRSANEPLIYDRGHLGELVWPRIFGRKTELDATTFRYIELAMHSQGGVLVYCRRDLDSVIADCARDGEPVQGSAVCEAVARFDDALVQTVLPTVSYDFERELDYRPTQNRIQRMALARGKLVAALHTITPRWIGYPRPDVLLVGETVGPGSTDWSLPFVPYRNTSGHFLLTELSSLGRGPAVAIVNAISPMEAPEPVVDLWEEMCRPPVVTLGKVADEVLQSQHVPHEPVQHPQYVRRFLRKNGPGWYAEQIVKAADLA